MTTESRRVFRMLCKAALLVCLPLAGYVWALPENSTMLAAAGGLTVLSLLVGFGAEYMASSAENDLGSLEQRMIDARHHRAEELAHQDERMRQLDRIVGTLTEQNHTLRGKLVAVQVDVQRRRDALLQAASGEVAKIGGAAADALRPAALRTN